MKKIFLMVLIGMFIFPLLSYGATFNLKASWTANTETDMKEYRLYRTDGIRTLIGTIPHPTVQYNFTLTVADGTQGTATFVLTAVDIALNESVDSVTVPFSWDLKPPAVPLGFGITKQ